DLREVVQVLALHEDAEPVAVVEADDSDLVEAGAEPSGFDIDVGRLVSEVGIEPPHLVGREPLAEELDGPPVERLPRLANLRRDPVEARVAERVRVVQVEKRLPAVRTRVP